MIGQYLGYGAISAVVGAIFYANLPTRLTIGAVGPTFKYLIDTKLKKLDAGKSPLIAAETSVNYCFFIPRF